MLERLTTFSLAACSRLKLSWQRFTRHQSCLDRYQIDPSPPDTVLAEVGRPTAVHDSWHLWPFEGLEAGTAENSVIPTPALPRAHPGPGRSSWRRFGTCSARSTSVIPLAVSFISLSRSPAAHRPSSLCEPRRTSWSTLSSGFL
jgi:hypothetical protein